MTVSLTYHESRTNQCAEGYSADSSISAVSSSFVFHYTENGSLFNLQACLLVQRNPLPTMEYISLMIRVGYVFQPRLAPSMYGSLFS